MKVRYAGDKLVLCTGSGGFYLAVAPWRRYYRLCAGLNVRGLIQVGRS